MKKLFILLQLLFLFSVVVEAQQILTTEEAINIALKNNYDILVSNNDIEIAKTNNTLGNAGMLPSVSLVGSDNLSLLNVHQRLATGTENKYPNAHTNSFNAGVALSWTLYDGGKMFVTKSKLSEIQSLGELEFKDKVSQTVYNIVTAYYDLVRQKQQLESINEVIAYNKERVKLLQTSFDAGLSPKNNLLQAKIDLNVALESAINQQTTIANAKRTLNQLLSRDVNTDFDVPTTIELTYKPNKDELNQKLYSTNTSVMAYQKQIQIAQLSLNEYQTFEYPKVTLNAGYNFLQTDNSYGTTLFNRSLGTQIGITASFPLYQSGNLDRQISVSRLQLKSAEYNLENVKTQINTQLQNALNVFENEQKLLEIEKENVTLAKENLEISMQRLRYGQTTALEVKIAQQSFEDSQTRLINFQYNLKIAETKLRQLMAEF